MTETTDTTTKWNRFTTILTTTAKTTYNVVKYAAVALLTGFALHVKMTMNTLFDAMDEGVAAFNDVRRGNYKDALKHAANGVLGWVTATFTIQLFSDMIRAIPKAALKHKGSRKLMLKAALAASWPLILTCALTFLAVLAAKKLSAAKDWYDFYSEMGDHFENEDYTTDDAAEINFGDEESTAA